MMNFDYTGQQTADYIMNDTSGGSLAERLGFSWNGAAEERNRLKEQADARELMAFQRSKFETKREVKRTETREVNTGRGRNVPSTPETLTMTAAGRQNTAAFLAQAGMIRG